MCHPISLVQYTTCSPVCGSLVPFASCYCIFLTFFGYSQVKVFQPLKWGGVFIFGKDYFSSLRPQEKSITSFHRSNFYAIFWQMKVKCIEEGVPISNMNKGFIWTNSGSDAEVMTTKWNAIQVIPWNKLLLWINFPTQPLTHKHSIYV